MILDGYGLNEKKEGNAVAIGKTPVMDMLMKKYPFVKGNASGMYVGLPDGPLPEVHQVQDTSSVTGDAGELAVPVLEDDDIALMILGKTHQIGQTVHVLSVSGLSHQFGRFLGLCAIALGELLRKVLSQRDRRKIDIHTSGDDLHLCDEQ